MEEERFTRRTTTINVLKALSADHDFFSKDEDLTANVQVYLFAEPLPADSFSKYKTKVIPNKVCIIRPYTIKYCIFRVI